MKNRDVLRFSKDSGFLKKQIGVSVEIDRLVAGNPHSDSETRDLLGQSADPLVKVLTAESPETSAETLLKLSRDETPVVRASAILNKRTPEDLFKEVIAREPYLFWTLHYDNDPDPTPIPLFNRDMYRTPVEGWETLSTYDIKRVLEVESLNGGVPAPLRILAAADQKTPLRTLKNILPAARYDVYLALALVRNRNSSTEILREFADSHNDTVRFEVAKNTDDPELYALMKEDPKHFVRLGTSLNSYADPSIRREIREERILKNLNVDGEESDVYSPTSFSTTMKNLSYERLSELFYSYKDLSPSLLAHLVRSGDTPEDLIRVMVQDESLDIVRKEVIGLFPSYNNEVSPEILSQLYEEENRRDPVMKSKLRLGLVLNPNTPYSVLDSLFKDGDESLNPLIIQNPNYNFDEYVDEFTKIRGS